MKFAVGLLLCLAFAAVLALTREELREKLRAASTKCQGNPATAIDEEALKTYLRSKGREGKPNNYGHHSLCMSKELGLQNDDGTINRERFRERISARIQDVAKVDEIINECTAQKEDEFATAGNLFKCFTKYAREEQN